MGDKRIYEHSMEDIEFDIKRVKKEPGGFCGNTCTKCCISAPLVDSSRVDVVKQEHFGWENAIKHQNFGWVGGLKQRNFGWEGDMWRSGQTDQLGYRYYDNYYGYGNIYSSEFYQQQLYRGYDNMTEVLSFDSQDFLMKSDIDLLQSVEYEFPLQLDSDVLPEVTQIEIITAPAKRKRGTGNKKTQAGTGAKRTTASTQYTTVPLPPCKVCGGVATGFHFGVITCEACKVNFQRLVTFIHDYLI